MWLVESGFRMYAFTSRAGEGRGGGGGEKGNPPKWGSPSQPTLLGCCAPAAIARIRKVCPCARRRAVEGRGVKTGRALPVRPESGGPANPGKCCRLACMTNSAPRSAEAKTEITVIVTND